MKLVVIKYNSGNTSSVLYALERLGINALLTDDHEAIRSADKVIFPGVGAASAAMADLKATSLDKLIPSLAQPVLGICVGMQVLCSYSEEGDTTCMGVFDQPIKKFQGDKKIPQIGWNNTYGYQSPLFRNIPEQSFMYFVHSYYMPVCAATICTAEYMLEYSAAVNKDNFYGVQFHPEKSGAAGQQLLQNFITL